MKIVPFIYNDFDDLCANTYLIYDKNSFCVVIDPSMDNDNLLIYIRKNNLTLKAILLTHGHVDHIRGVDRLYKAFKCDIYIHYLDEDALKDENINLSNWMNENVKVRSPYKTVTDKEVLKILEEDIVVIHTPYHTIGSCCYFLKESNALFSGDSLFRGSIGRDDFITSDRRKRKESLDKLMSLEDDVKVYPGHGTFTSIGIERINNPFVNK